MSVAAALHAEITAYDLHAPISTYALREEITAYVLYADFTAYTSGPLTILGALTLSQNNVYTAPNDVQDGPRSAPDGPGVPQDTPGGAQDVAKVFPKASLRPPRKSTKTPLKLNLGSKTAQNSFARDFKTPEQRHPTEAPKTMQDAFVPQRMPGTMPPNVPAGA